ncbi:hypothetical protein LguiA_004897 [Lonicera macranthoides]
MVVTRSKRKLLDLQPPFPTHDITDGTISADNFSPEKISKMTSNLVSESSCNWHATHEEAFVQLLEEEFDMGRMGMNNTLSAKQVNEMSSKLKERIRRFFDAQQIRAKFNRMKAKTNAFHKLINTTGFGWNPETNTVTAEENVWTTYLKWWKGSVIQRTMTSLDALIETMSETSCAKRAHYDAKKTYVDEHIIADCVTVLSTMPVSGVQYDRAAEKLISGKDWRTFFLLSSAERQLEWVNGLE